MSKAADQDSQSGRPLFRLTRWEELVAVSGGPSFFHWAMKVYVIWRGWVVCVSGEVVSALRSSPGGGSELFEPSRFPGAIGRTSPAEVVWQSCAWGCAVSVSWPGASPATAMEFRKSSTAERQEPKGRSGGSTESPAEGHSREPSPVPVLESTLPSRSRRRLRPPVDNRLRTAMIVNRTGSVPFRGNSHDSNHETD